MHSCSKEFSCRETEASERYRATRKGRAAKRAVDCPITAYTTASGVCPASLHSRRSLSQADNALLWIKL